MNSANWKTIPPATRIQALVNIGLSKDEAEDKVSTKWKDVEKYHDKLATLDSQGHLQDATNFDGIKIKPRQTCTCNDPTKVVECPVCHGHGNWNIDLHAYGKNQHFQAFCSQCWGWGWVLKDSKDATCIHEFNEISQKECKEIGIAHFGNCWHVEKCKKCGVISSYDSSG